LPAGIGRLVRLAVLSKEHTIVLPALLLLTGLPGAPRLFLPRRARKLCGCTPRWLLGAAGAVALFWKVILYSPSAGFSLRWRELVSVFVYPRAGIVRLPGRVLLPVRLTADWDFPVFPKRFRSRRHFRSDRAGGAWPPPRWHYRRRFRWACFGFFALPGAHVADLVDPADCGPVGASGACTWDVGIAADRSRPGGGASARTSRNWPTGISSPCC